MIGFSDITTSALVTVVAPGLVSLWLLRKLLGPAARPRSPIRDLPGPTSWNWLLGQFLVLYNAPVAVPQEEWVAKYGKNICWTEIFNVMSLLFFLEMYWIAEMDTVFGSRVLE